MAIWLSILGITSALACGVPVLMHSDGSPDGRWKTVTLAIDRNGMTDLTAGLIISTLVMSVVFFSEWLFRLISVGGIHAPDAAWLYVALWLVPQAFLEELLFRGFMLNGLYGLFRSKWIAVSVSSLAFGFIHATYPHATPLSVIGNALGGAMYALAYLRTGRLWLGTALHFGWNFVQGPVFGFPVSGRVIGGLTLLSWDRERLFTGGDYGPEGGLIGIIARFLVMALVVAWCNARTVGSSSGERGVASGHQG